MTEQDRLVHLRLLGDLPRRRAVEPLSRKQFCGNRQDLLVALH